MDKRVSISDLKAMKKRGDKIVMLTAYDYPSARLVEEAGVHAIVLECVPLQLARAITERVSIPTIGIGAGPHCDGQVQVFHDLLGLFTDFVPKHAKRYAQVGEAIKQAVSEYVAEVREGVFPTEHESFFADESAFSELK